MLSARELYQSTQSRLNALYPPQESQSLVYWLMEHFLAIKRPDILKDIEIKNPTPAFELAVKELEKGRPVQYILGFGPFYGRDFKVDHSVLIPRNETEELVHLIINENPHQDLKILDIGTGTGCIPITLFLEMKAAKVAALDISKAALAIARQNAAELKAKVEFYETDILKEEIPIHGLDIIVSNPPYVRELEKAEMHQNVLEYEPQLALFVTDDDPLIFYRTIAKKSMDALVPHGKIYFEINEAFGDEMYQMMASLGYEAVKIYQDMQGKDRILSAVKPLS
ncbi:peptide chain release factor N(5)-glutamine methyltransferase [Echinicola sp. CAU 1574]|uniref:peptide chain release factor N(5)-glutamine methyltransferase n=1 Tax=Echinicola arenosa TaxID=2774144 RepID=A0ABR9AIJ2_9BACT|nr:peptide chain release factor N(5)-glutamine methyltransferase [Echinicola arenosa]MBD8488623.1 peptide chain release factor N(5)-glutamine methyltransferase [Echinicola arenosa]